MGITGIQKLLGFSAVLILMFFSSCDDILFENDISESYVHILAPKDQSNISSGLISFHWDPVEYADRYNIQIATPDFEHAKQLVADSNVTGTSFQWQLLPNSYEWRIRAENSAFKTIYFYKKLTVSDNENFSESEVLLSAPPVDFVSNEPDQNLFWEQVAGATEYRVQVTDSDSSGAIIFEETVSDTSIKHIFEDGDYFWRVRAQNSTQNTLFFSRSILIDTREPEMAVLSSPVDKSSQEEGMTTFKWDRNSIEGSSEFDSIYVFNDESLSNLIWKDKSEVKQIVKELNADHYFWMVRSFDNAGNTGPDSDVFELEVE